MESVESMWPERFSTKVHLLHQCGLKNLPSQPSPLHLLNSRSSEALMYDILCTRKRKRNTREFSDQHLERCPIILTRNHRPVRNQENFFLVMYSLAPADDYHFAGPEQVYVLEVDSTAAGLVAISSDCSAVKTRKTELLVY